MPSFGGVEAGDPNGVKVNGEAYLPNYGVSRSQALCNTRGLLDIAIHALESLLPTYASNKRFIRQDPAIRPFFAMLDERRCGRCLGFSPKLTLAIVALGRQLLLVCDATQIDRTGLKRLARYCRYSARVIFMDQHRGMFTPPKPVPASWRGQARDRAVSPKRILCVLPRRLRVNPLKSLLAGYELSVADTRTRTLRVSRQEAHDLIVIYAPLGWADAAVLCASLQQVDRHTPLIVYSTIPSPLERMEVTSIGAAYVRRADDVHNLAAMAGQLVMLAELRSIEALAERSRMLEDDLVRRLARIPNGGEILPACAVRLKQQSRRMFASAGGSRANFERLWPSLFEAALKRVREDSKS